MAALADVFQNNIGRLLANRVDRKGDKEARNTRENGSVNNDLSPIQPQWLPPNIFDNLKPGGWVEFHETANTLYSEDKSLRSDNALVQLMEGLMKACENIGRTFDPAPSLQKWAKEAGFTQVTEQRVRLPVGRWPKDKRLRDIGTLMAANFYKGVQRFTAKTFRDILGWSEDEVEILNASVMRASRYCDARAMFDFVVVTTRKPL
ncbi:hypothetical protein RAB80_010118 [Fusarium oxysporum f. sp. vasinfectum]|uniref:Methyltransferase tdiE n=2 Tax=Fusarium oxysporum TaxID=5507 RepID=X0LA89_FUSOX|nr:hypothetical protein FOTG_13849 [Fusarium oxysporum f. sp. vasinfectum 25433]KAK2675134.1 hypothetical protein RAB80_010118 [Fusarium oxysporum f. sp. vasinfectum]KAK2931560.1 hypothetical protein FoTM2_009072 [Fusarium oxysporum f. sp. vasinfectum]TVY62602.1 putative methyltransferase tdiE [Fusarium oxysporum f. sp. cubense]